MVKNYVVFGETAREGKWWVEGLLLVVLKNRVYRWLVKRQEK
jgi:hypothetical protein